MKRELKLADKIRITLKWWERHRDCGLVSACSCCGSTRIKRVLSNTDSTQRDKITYTAKYECMECHATATCEETWLTEGHQID